MAKLISLFRCGLFLALILSSLPPASAHAGDTVAIVNKDLPLTHLTIKDLQLIYKGKKRTWDNGESIVLCLPPFGSKPMNFLVHRVFRINSEAEVSGFYLHAVFQQVFVNPPKSYADTRFAVIDVEAIPGAIAIVDRSQIPAGHQVKVVEISDEP